MAQLTRRDLVLGATTPIPVGRHKHSEWWTSNYNPSHVIIRILARFGWRPSPPPPEFPPPTQFNSTLTMLSIVAKSSSRCLPPLTFALRSFSSSAATRQAVPTETKSLNKEFKIYRWVLFLPTLLACHHSPLTPLSPCRTQMNRRKNQNYSPTPST